MLLRCRPHLTSCFSRGLFRLQSTSSATPEPKFLVTGGLGQIGVELVRSLRERYPAESVILTDIRAAPASVLQEGPAMQLDVLDYRALEQVVSGEGITHIVHLSALLSASAESSPQLAINVNSQGAFNVLEVARTFGTAVFAPSTIAVYGDDALPKKRTPDGAVTRPTTIYGITKVYLEMLGEYYHAKYGVDFRSLRYPGIVSPETLPGGGTTDYAVHVFYDGVAGKPYECYLRSDTRMPMMYMPDCLKATVDLIHADSTKLSRRVYNVGAIDFTPAELFDKIKEMGYPLEVSYAVDPGRQAIAESWPHSLDDTPARKDWGWAESYSMEDMIADMWTKLTAKQEKAKAAADAKAAAGAEAQAHKNE